MNATIHYDECYVLLINGEFEEASAMFDDVVNSAQQAGFNVVGGDTGPPTLTYML